MTRKKTSNFLQENLAVFNQKNEHDIDNNSFIIDFLMVFAKVMGVERERIANLNRDSFWNHWRLGQFNKQEWRILRYYLPLRLYLRKPMLLAHCLCTAFGIPFSVIVEDRMLALSEDEGIVLGEAILNHNTILGGTIEERGPMYTIRIKAVDEKALNSWMPHSRNHIFLEQVFLPIILPQGSDFQIFVDPQHKSVCLSSDSSSSFIEVNFILG